MTPLSTLLTNDEMADRVRKQLPSADPARYLRLARQLAAGIDDSRISFLVSAPGRSELAGGHTDHNRGKVLAASVQLDSIAVVCPRDDTVVRLASDGFPAIEMDLEDLGIRESERETTAALVRGVAAALVDGGHAVGGFDAAVSSQVLPGSGLSSSASIEILVGTIFDHGWNNDKIGAVEVAKAGKVAENRYFGKPCGLMDQIACAHGGIVYIDFRNEDNPGIEPVSAAFESAGLSMLVVDTGGSHADLTPDYAAIPDEMKSVAKFFGATELADLSVDRIVRNFTEVRNKVNDRALARSLHFFAEVDRVERMVSALKNNDYQLYTRLMFESGRSSGLFLQNSAPPSSPESQAVVVGLALTDVFIQQAGLQPGLNVASRVQGGGFAGTILVLMPSDSVGPYRNFIEPLLGDGAVTEISIRKQGAVAW